MKVLVVGNGGREAAIAWKLAQSPKVHEVCITPPHPVATRLHPKITTSADYLAKEFHFAVVGPEIPLGEGLADQLRAAGVVTLGPSQKAAQLEISKAFAKDLMKKAGIPTAESQTVTGVAEAAHALEKITWSGVVVKVDGPAQGKGVVVCETKADALRAISAFCDGTLLGAKFDRFVLEERLSGPEISCFALCSGERFAMLDSARDHKRLLENDLGPNTGGMGTLSPVADFTQEETRFVADKVVAPLLETMSAEGHPFQGFLFVGLMRTPQGPKVLEFNVRLGDPEAQVLLPRLEDDLFDWLYGAARGELPAGAPSFSAQKAVHVVLAAPGYPGVDGQKIRLGDELQLPQLASPESIIFPAGVTTLGEKVISRGGRILGVTGLGATHDDARTRALQLIEQLAFEGSHFRRDIGGQL